MRFQILVPDTDAKLPYYIFIVVVLPPDMPHPVSKNIFGEE